MYKEKYQQMYEQIVPQKTIVNEVITTVRERDKRKQWIQKRGWRFGIATMVGLSLSVMVGIPVLAANIPVFYNVMYEISPAAAQFFMPVNKSCEDQGILMEVESAYIHGDTAEIYVTMQDLVGDRIDETIDLYDSATLHQPFGGVGTCRQVDYDAENKKATFLVQYANLQEQDITGDKITFSIREFLSHKKKWEQLPIEMNPEQYLQEAVSIKVRERGGGGMNRELINVDSNGMTAVLKPQKALDSFPVEGIEITGMGYVDGLFHVQMYIYDRMETDNHGFVYLTDSEGNTINSAYSLYFTVNEEDFGKKEYVENVFAVSTETLKECELFGNFTTCDSLVKGNWQVTFPLEEWPDDE